jgi:hypothetical protein
VLRGLFLFPKFASSIRIFRCLSIFIFTATFSGLSRQTGAPRRHCTFQLDNPTIAPRFDTGMYFRHGQLFAVRCSPDGVTATRALTSLLNQKAWN